MGPLDRLKGRRVGFDTAPFVYYHQENPTYLPLVEPIFDALHAGDLEGVSSMLTLVEMLVHPLRCGDVDLAERGRRILLAERHLTVLPVDGEVAERAARLRATYGLRTPDAIQVAAAIIGEATHLLTNDLRLKRVAEVEVVALDDFLGAERS